jgi:hypothetical protein
MTAWAKLLTFYCPAEKGGTLGKLATDLRSCSPAGSNFAAMAGKIIMRSPIGWNRSIQSTLPTEEPVRDLPNSGVLTC